MFLKHGKSWKINSFIDHMNCGIKLSKQFFTRDVLDVAPEMPGKIMVIKLSDGEIGRFMVTDVEAYRGVEDKACHASKGRTARTEIMYQEGGRIYVYLIYGVYWMLNIVTGAINEPQAVLIRGLDKYAGPGKLSKYLGIERSYYGEDITISERIWFEDAGLTPVISTGPRIGINYAGENWKSKPWRFFIKLK
jgi:DNA-3-methyladenine glycosylase